ncbi:zinc finger, CCHC-type containing protein [Tanacetum coccineum]
MFTRHEGQGKPFREHGQGRFNQSRGQENNKFRSERKNWESSQNNFKKKTDSNTNKFTHDKSKVLCFKCKEYGYFANKCPSKKEEQSNLIEEDLEPTSLMATIEEAPGSENLDGGVTESMSREDIYAARTPIGRQSVGSITNQKHDQSGFMIDHNNEGGSNRRKIDLPGCKDDHKLYKKSNEDIMEEIVRRISNSMEENVRGVSNKTNDQSGCTIDQSSSSSDGGFNQKMDQEDLIIVDD